MKETFQQINKLYNLGLFPKYTAKIINYSDDELGAVINLEHPHQEIKTLDEKDIQRIREIATTLVANKLILERSYMFKRENSPRLMRYNEKIYLTPKIAANIEPTRFSFSTNTVIYHLVPNLLEKKILIPAWHISMGSDHPAMYNSRPLVLADFMTSIKANKIKNKVENFKLTDAASRLR